MTPQLSPAQWLTAIDEADPPTFGEVVQVLEESDMVDGEARELVEKAIATGEVVEDENHHLRLEGEQTDPEDTQTPGVNPGADADKPPSTPTPEGDIDLDGVDGGTYPRDLVEEGARWLLWQYREDRKIPRNPEWGPVEDDGYTGWTFAGNKDPRAWFNFDKAKAWTEHDPDLRLAYYLASPDRDDWDGDREEKYDWVDPEEDVPDEPHVGLLDFDDIRDPETGDVAPEAAELLERVAHTFEEWSPSGTGAHALGGFRLPEGVDAPKIDLSSEAFPDAELEIYAGRRYTTITGDHIPGTATETTDIQAAIDGLLDEYPGAVEKARSRDPEDRPEELDRDPDKSREEIASIEETDDIQDVFDAIQHTRPEDIRIRSPVTEERADGSKSRDPAWTESKSGTRLAQVGDGFVYRKGMVGLDVLQLVALEERIITDVDEYPQGEAFWSAVDALRERGAEIPEFDPPEQHPASALPLERLKALDPEEARRYARKHGLEWPSTREVRARIRERILEAFRDEESVMIDAPTSAGKSFAVATEPWRDRRQAGGQPVIQFHKTREARDQALTKTREYGGEAAVLNGREEACAVAAGAHDPPENAEEDPPDQIITVDGTPASEYFTAMCDGKGLPFSVVHKHVEEHNDQDADLPCSPSGAECPAIAQWNGVPRDDAGDPAADVIHATHDFAHVPGLRVGVNVVFDERPDFSSDLGQDRIRRAVTAFLNAVDEYYDLPIAPTYEALVEAGKGGLTPNEHDPRDLSKRYDVLDEALDFRPDPAWYFNNPNAHTLAPALARAIFFAEDQGNGRRAATVPHEPPRLDAGAKDRDAWNREWVSVVLDKENTVRKLRASPDFTLARAVVGLDAHPTALLWQRNVDPSMAFDRILDHEERRLWRFFERGLEVVQVGDATRPGTTGEYFNPDASKRLLTALRDGFGDEFRTAITPAAVEAQHRDLMEDVGIPDPETMHYGEEKSREDFAEEAVGLVNMSIDPGDDYVLDLLAEAGLDAEPETVERDGEEVRAHGRGFVGEDAGAAREILASVREQHVAQAAGRYARNAEDPDDRAVVFVRTSAMPPGFADLKVPGVEWVPTETQAAILEKLQDRPKATTREIAEELDVTKEHVRETLERLEEEELVDRFREAGEYGADLYQALLGIDTAGVNLAPEETTNGDVRDLCTWSLAIASPNVRDPTARGATATALPGVRADRDVDQAGLEDFPPG